MNVIEQIRKRIDWLNKVIPEATSNKQSLIIQLHLAEDDLEWYLSEEIRQVLKVEGLYEHTVYYCDYDELIEAIEDVDPPDGTSFTVHIGNMSGS
jgi:hypothetical protein